MKINVYSVRDTATADYNNPMYLQGHGLAIRAFGDAINKEDDNSNLWKHPGDFNLYYLGEFDTTTGLFATGTPEQIAIGKDLVVPKK